MAKRLFTLGLLVGVLAPVIVTYWPQIVHTLSSAEQVRNWVRSFGVFAPLALIAAQAVQIVVAPVPGYFVSAAGGYLFGLWAGTIYGVVGMLLGGSVAFSLSRYFGTPLVKKLVPERHLAGWGRFAHVDSLLTWVIILALPLGDVVYYVAGLTSLPLRKMLYASAISRTLGVFLSCLVGAKITDVPEHLALVAALAVLILATAVFVFKERLQTFIVRNVLRRMS